MIRYGILKTACLLAATFLVTACTDDVSDGTALPPGEYPMTFATALEGPTQTGSTTENIWAGNERIAVKVGDEVKEYTPTTSGAEATLTGKDADNTFYWQHVEETKEVSAWYSGAKYTAQLSSFSVKTDQSTDEGYRQSDFLYAKPQDITYSSRATHQLTFEHLPAKVIVHLKNGDGVTENEVKNATVCIVNQATTSGTINATAGTVEQITTPGTEEINPYVLTAPGAGYQQSVQALVVPQQMAGKDFVKITIGTGAAARNFYYVPVGENDANLLSGKQYTYNITVNKTELAVEIVSGTWNDEILSDATTGGDFQIYLPEFTAPQNTENFMVTDAHGAPLTATNGMYKTSNSISISLSSSKGYILNKYLVKVAAGICKQRVSYIADTRTYTYTFYDFRSDLWIGSIEAEAKISSTLPSAQVGDFYYIDGTWSTELQKPCIGIVFKTGVGENDAPENYKNKLNEIHGYVVALTDANENAGAWGIRGVDVEDVTNEPDNVNKYDGYSNTAIVRKLDAYNNTNVGTPIANGQYWAFKVASEYNKTAPATSSGWYLPSIGQLSDIYNLQNRSQLLNVAGGDDFETVENNGRYWSSTERHSADAWYYQFNSAGVGAYAKSNDGGSDLLRPSYVRAVLTF